MGWLTLSIATWLAWCFAARALLRGPRPSPLVGLTWHAMRAYARLVHRLRVEGRENLGVDRSNGLIVVANHTAGVDPLLIQAAIGFEIRWVMASDMRIRALEPVWTWLDIIFVDRFGRTEPASLRSAIRHLARGGVLGIFPEGGIERPARSLLRFQPGLGLLVRRSRSPVLPIVVEGTPDAPTAWGSLFRTSHALMRVMPPISFDEALKPEEVAEDMRNRFQAWTGWPLADAPAGRDQAYY